MANCLWFHKEHYLSWSILVVDDEPNTVEFLRITLEMGGYEVLEALSGTAALRQVAAHKPDLVLLDVMMPEMDGLEVCRRLRADLETADLPIVILSARTSVEAIREGLDAGATRYLTKPVTRDNLLETIREVLDPLFTP